jgi:tRNA-dihydrouridine synthase B
VSIQIFGGEPAKMAEAARVVEQMGANIVDVNMGCPVPKIARHNAGCSLMREPEHAAAIIAAMSNAVKIPVTVKMRKGWDDGELNAGELAKRVEDAGAKAIAIHGRTAKQSYSGVADWAFVSEIARTVSIPVFGSGDCVEPEDIVARLQSGVSGVYVGRGVLRNPWILAQARDLMEGRPARTISHEERGQFLLDYMHLLLTENVDEAAGFRHSAPTDAKATAGTQNQREAVGRERWVINKIRALCSWYTKGFEGGAQFRIGVNSAKSITELRDLIEGFFLLNPAGLLAR